MIFELGVSAEMIHITAQYSNAVLVALLPYVNDVVGKLDLPVTKPVTAAHVFHCSILPQRKPGDVRAEIGITNNWVFVFSRGYIETIQGPHSYYHLQDPAEIPQYYGAIRMTKAEAIELGRQTIRKLGIPLEAVFAEQEPRVKGPIKIGTNTVPHYRIEWLDPRGVGQAPACVDMDVNGNTMRVERLRIFNKNLERPPPQIGIVPQSFPVFPHSTNPEYARRLVPFVFHAIDEYGKTLSLPIPRPLTTNHVAKFSLADNGGWPHCEIELTNGWRFIYRNSMVNGHYAPDNFFNSDNRPILIKEFAAKTNITEQEAVELVRKTIDKFNYPTNLVHVDFEPSFHRPALPGIPRLFVFWNTETEDDLQSKVEAEVDLNRRELKSLYYDDKAYWNHPPSIDVPITLPTKAGGAASPQGARRQKVLPFPAPPGSFKLPSQQAVHPKSRPLDATK